MGRKSGYEEEAVEIIQGASLQNLYEIYYCMSTGEFAAMSGCSEEDQEALIEIVKQEIKEKRKQ